MKRTIAISVLLCLVPMALFIVPWQDVMYEVIGTVKLKATGMGSFSVPLDECDRPPLNTNAELHTLGQALDESGVQSGWFEIRRKRFSWTAGDELKITLLEVTD